MSENERVVHVVDDDESVRRSVSFMLKTSGYCVHSYADGAELLNAAKSLEPGCILLDIRMPGMDGLGLQETLRGQGIALPIVIMTGHGDVALSVKAMKAGAIDFIEKPFEKDVLISAIESGFVALSQADRGRDRAKDAAVRLEVLTLREREVLDALAQGCSNKAIAYDLGISPRTVEIHRAHLMTKLGVRSLSEALRLAFAVEEASRALNGG
jgi:two-component system response regulator FixJ